MRWGVRSPLSQPSISQGPGGGGGSPRQAFQCITVRSVFPLLDTVSSDCPAASGAGLPEAVTGGTQRTRGSLGPQPFSASPAPPDPHHGGLPDLSSRGQSPASPSVLTEAPASVVQRLRVAGPAGGVSRGWSRELWPPRLFRGIFGVITTLVVVPGGCPLWSSAEISAASLGLCAGSVPTANGAVSPCASKSFS